MSKDRNIVTTVSLPYKLMFRIAMYCEWRSIRRSQAVRELLTRGLDCTGHDK